MSESEAPTVDELARRKARRLRIGIGCLVATFLLCCVPCGFAGTFGVRRGELVTRHSPPPDVDPAGVDDPVWRRVAEARRSAMSSSCEDVSGALFESLADETPEVRDAIVAGLRERLGALTTDGLYASCHAASRMNCDAHRFARFRARIVLSGQPVYELALRDADAYVRYLPPSNRCEGLVERIGVDTSATLEPMSREEVRATVPRTCRRFGCVPADLF